MSDSTEDFRTVCVRDKHESFIREVVDILIKDAVFDGTARDNRVVEWIDPESLIALLGVNLPEHPQSNQQMINTIRHIVKYSVKTGHPRFINQLFSGLDPYGLAAQWITDALNPSVYTYEVAPVFTVLEDQVLREMRRYVGYPNGDGDGLFVPGGSMANTYAMHCARHRALPNFKVISVIERLEQNSSNSSSNKRTDLTESYSILSNPQEEGSFGSPRLVVFTSKDAHYSVKKAAFLLGIGSSNIYLINVDECGRMDPAHLRQEIERAIKENAKPIMVSATAGTTVLGAIDPLDDIADLCHEFGIWMHVDAAWGGGILMSLKYRPLLKGIERSDSVAWNPHKLLAVPQQCSTFLIRDQDMLLQANSASAVYLFQQDKFYDPKWDVGDKYLQCGRRADVLKLWLMWQAKGSTGLEKHVDTLFSDAEYFTQLIQEREGFKLVLDKPEFVNICFWYIPPSLRGCQDEADYNEKLDKVAPKIKERMVKSGSMMITYTALGNLPNFFRLVLQSSAVTFEDMTFFADEIERLGSDL